MSVGWTPQFDALVRAPGNAEMFNPVTQFIGIGDVLLFDIPYTLGIGFVKLQRDAEGYGAHDGQLVRRIDALNVEGRVSLRITQRLGFLQYLAEVPALVAHLGQDEVSRAVDYARSPLNAVRHQALAHRLDNGNPAGDCGLECHDHAFFPCGAENLIAVYGNHGLVCGNYMFAVVDGAQDHFLRRGVAAYQFDDDVHFRVIDRGKSVVGNPPYLVQSLDCAGVVFLCRGVADDHLPAGAAGNFMGVPGQYRDDATADRAQAEQP